MPFDSPVTDPAQLGFDTRQLQRLVDYISAQIADGKYPGCEIALARHGKLALHRHFGHARVTPDKVAADARTLWLLYSNTKVITAAAVWQLVERGALGFTDKLSDHIPGFAKNAKRDITVIQLLTHQGGFPEVQFPFNTWEDRDRRRQFACDIALQWTPGTQIVYHALAAHWVAAVLIEAITGRDFREVIRDELVAPIGLAGEIFVGLPDAEHARAADMHVPDENGALKTLDENNTPAWRRAGAPGGGGYATAKAMAAFYQMLLAGGKLNGARVLSPRTLQYAIRNFTDDRVDQYMGMPMHRGLGPHLRGQTANIRGLGALAAPRTFGHGGVGSSYCWADPESGVSFAYITNARIPDPWHSTRLDRVANLVHAAIVD